MIYEILKELGIKYEEMTHQAVYTVSDAKKVEKKLEGIGCKNLFLTNHKDKYYIYVLEENKKANLKELASFLKERHLSFASEEELKLVLNLERGNVTPLAIINDKENKTELVFDKTLVGNKILCHPNTNTKTISIDYSDLIKLIESQEHSYQEY